MAKSGDIEKLLYNKIYAKDVVVKYGEPMEKESITFSSEHISSNFPLQGLTIINSYNYEKKRNT